MLTQIFRPSRVTNFNIGESLMDCRIILTSISTLQHHPYELVSAKFVLLKRASWGDWVGDPNGRMLPFIRTTDTLEVQILSYDVLCH